MENFHNCNGFPGNRGNRKFYIYYSYYIIKILSKNAQKRLNFVTWRFLRTLITTMTIKNVLVVREASCALGLTSSPGTSDQFSFKCVQILYLGFLGALFTNMTIKKFPMVPGARCALGWTSSPGTATNFPSNVFKFYTCGFSGILVRDYHYRDRNQAAVTHRYVLKLFDHYIHVHGP